MDEFWADDVRGGWTPAQLEAYLQYQCWRFYKTERHAYELLQDLQGTRITKVYDHPYIQASFQPEPKAFKKYLDCPGILLEYISGYPLTELRDRAPIKDW